MCNTKIDKIVKSLVAPSQTNVGWLDLNDNSLKFFVNGEWKEIKDEKGESVQADWEQSDSSKPDYIKNKPSIDTPFVSGTGEKSAKTDETNITATAKGSFAHGSIFSTGGNIEATAEGAHAEGVAQQGGKIIASGIGAHVEGVGSNTSESHAARALASHAEGMNNYIHADATAAHVEGSWNKVYMYATSSHAEGTGTVTANSAEHAEGRYNKTTTGTRHSVGIGTSDSDRKNAHEIMNDGKHYIYGVGGYDGTNPTATGVQDLASVLNEFVTIFYGWVDENGKFTENTDAPASVAHMMKGIVILADEGAGEYQMVIAQDSSFNVYTKDWEWDNI